MTSVLMVLTGANVWTMKNGAPHPTGFWSEEFVAPHQSFTGAGLDVSVATPRGRAPAVDPLSLDLRFNTGQADVDSQKAYLAAQQPQLDKPLALGDVSPADYDVLFIVGGHGPMQDLAVDPDIGGLIGAFLGDPDKILAAVCHGPASFLSAHDADGNWLFKGRRLTAFSNEEENQSGFAGNAPWLLEDRLRLAGALYQAEAPWTSAAVTDANLVTGQQNYSAQVTADAVLRVLEARPEPCGTRSRSNSTSRPRR